MSLFRQKPFKLSLSDTNNAIEKCHFGPIKAPKVKIKLNYGTSAVIGNTNYLMPNYEYEVNIQDLVLDKGDYAVAYLYQTKFYNNLEIQLFVGDFILACDFFEKAKLRYHMVISTNIQLSNIELVISNFNNTYTVEDLKQAIKGEIESIIRGSCKQELSKIINENPTPNYIYENKQSIYEKIRVVINKEISMSGLVLSNINDIKLNKPDETEEQIRKIIQTINDEALKNLDAQEANSCLNKIKNYYK